jgi:hypothetical protein
LAQLNHAITYLPEFGLYADTTVGVAPFGTLPFQEYGKPVIHVAASGPARRQIPVLKPAVAATSLKTMIRLEPSGAASGESTVVAEGPFAINLRLLGEMVQSFGPERATQGILQANGVNGSGAVELSPPLELASTYSITGHFREDARPELVSGGPFPIQAGLRMAGFTGDMLMGSLLDRKPKEAESTPCFSGRMSEDLTMTAPPGRHFGRPPADSDIKTANLHFTAHWSGDGSQISVHRDFVSTIDQPLCTGEIRKAAVAALRQIQRSYEAEISLPTH